VPYDDPINPPQRAENLPTPKGEPPTGGILARSPNRRLRRSRALFRRIGEHSRFHTIPSLDPSWAPCPKVQFRQEQAWSYPPFRSCIFDKPSTGPPLEPFYTSKGKHRAIH